MCLVTGLSPLLLRLNSCLHVMFILLLVFKLFVCVYVKCLLLLGISHTEYYNGLQRRVDGSDKMMKIFEKERTKKRYFQIVKSRRARAPNSSREDGR